MIRILPVCLLFFLTPLFAAPDLFCPEMTYDFGEKPSGSKVEHDFVLENRGDDVLKISSIRSSCGCTTPGVKKMILRAGERKKLPVVIDLKDRSGPQVQHVTLRTNDPNQPAFSLKVIGEAVPEIRVEPRTLNLKQMNAETAHRGVVRLTSTNGKPFTITSVKANRNRVTPTVKMAEDELSAEIYVVPKPQKGQGHFTDVLEIKTSNPNVRELRVLVMWQISTGISVAPGQVSLVLMDNDSKLDRYLLVRGHPGLKEPLKVTAVEWPGQEVDILVTDTQKFGWRIHLKSFRPHISMKDTELLIHTNAEGFETLKVPVRILEK